jgi:hypothetical protein
MKKDFSFAEFTAVNLERAKRWHGEAGVMDPNWSVSDWSNAAAGEVGEAAGAVLELLALINKHSGEVCNKVKKLRRIQTGMQQHGNVPANVEEAIEQVGKEIGDSVIYFNLLAERCGLSLQECIRAAFNGVSVREGFPERL